ncbi:hypothetical protein L195_g058985 [Trifolium pratense]|uniref:Uncharacterized protein n=1 Tax=Trifolium pratense TaxID=57577 RepID=A0A2K3JVF1_TRIPR|nr:hypothetical protein L195_g058985 [Trifolium pratense]
MVAAMDMPIAAVWDKLEWSIEAADKKTETTDAVERYSAFANKKTKQSNFGLCSDRENGTAAARAFTKKRIACTDRRRRSIELRRSKRRRRSEKVPDSIVTGNADEKRCCGGAGSGG